jgi:hypothetical protein
MNETILSKIVYDVDNRYVDLSIRTSLGGGDAFILTMSDTSNDEESDSEIELFLTRKNLQLVIDRLSEALK